MDFKVITKKVDSSSKMYFLYKKAFPFWKGFFVSLKLAYNLGFGPYLLSPTSLSFSNKTKIQIAPISGIKTIKYIQPLLPTSWSLLTTTARLGINTDKA